MDEPTFVVERNPRLRLLIPSVVAIAFLMEQLDSTIITTAIPYMARSLATTPVRMNLAVTSYVLTLAVFIPLSGWFADRFGARRIFVLALAIFTVGSALCGLADSFAMLVATRVLQGLGGAMMTPVGRLILLRSFPRRDLVTAMTYMTLPAIIGPVIGPLLGGVLTTYFSWRWIFYVNLPFGLIGILLALRYMENTTGDGAVRFDFSGFMIFGCAIALLQLGMDNVGRSQLPAAAIVTLFAVAAALLLGFTRYARRVAVPVVDLTLFRQRSFAIGTLAGGLCRVALNGTPFLLPLMLQIGFGMSPIASGSLTFLSTGGALTIRLFIRWLLRSFGYERVLIGSALISSAVLAGFTLLGPHTSRWLIGLYVIVFGLTRSTQYMTSNTLSYADTPSARLSQATSLGGLIQQLTVSFGVSLSAVLLDLVSLHDHRLTPAHFHEVFLLSALLPLLALPGFLRLRPEDGAQVSGYRRG
ncbi:MAG TPA: DHA2 family efflux MFS transporter permease subunit [Steroidobacteraceae bacterium]|nr:DHA2 family efflux MFS transporter permease subunit [Steroidobacteraceae bacterium]